MRPKLPLPRRPSLAEIFGGHSSSWLRFMGHASLALTVVGAPIEQVLGKAALLAIVPTLGHVAVRVVLVVLVVLVVSASVLLAQVAATVGMSR